MSETLGNITGALGGLGAIAAVPAAIIKKNADFLKSFSQENRADKMKKKMADKLSAKESKEEASQFFKDLNAGLINQFGQKSSGTKSSKNHTSTKKSSSEEKPSVGVGSQSKISDNKEKWMMDKLSSNHDELANLLGKKGDLVKAITNLMTGHKGSMDEHLSQREFLHMKTSKISNTANALAAVNAWKNWYQLKEQKELSKETGKEINDMRHMAHQNWVATTSITRELVRIHSVLVNDTDKQSGMRMARMSEERAEGLQREAYLDGELARLSNDQYSNMTQLNMAKKHKGTSRKDVEKREAAQAMDKEMDDARKKSGEGMRDNIKFGTDKYGQQYEKYAEINKSKLQPPAGTLLNSLDGVGGGGETLDKIAEHTKYIGPMKANSDGILLKLIEMKTQLLKPMLAATEAKFYEAGLKKGSIYTHDEGTQNSLEELVTLFRGSKTGQKSGSTFEWMTPNKDYAETYGDDIQSKVIDMNKSKFLTLGESLVAGEEQSWGSLLKNMDKPKPGSKEDVLQGKLNILDGKGNNDSYTNNGQNKFYGPGGADASSLLKGMGYDGIKMDQVGGMGVTTTYGIFKNPSDEENFSQFVKAGLEKGSIYTHDLTSQELLESIDGKLGNFTARDKKQDASSRRSLLESKSDNVAGGNVKGGRFAKAGSMLKGAASAMGRGAAQVAGAIGGATATGALAILGKIKGLIAKIVKKVSFKVLLTWLAKRFAFLGLIATLGPLALPAAILAAGLAAYSVYDALKEYWNSINGFDFNETNVQIKKDQESVNNHVMHKRVKDVNFKAKWDPNVGNVWDAKSFGGDDNIENNQIGRIYDKIKAKRAKGEGMNGFLGLGQSDMEMMDSKMMEHSKKIKKYNIDIEKWKNTDQKKPAPVKPVWDWKASKTVQGGLQGGMMAGSLHTEEQSLSWEAMIQNLLAEDDGTMGTAIGLQINNRKRDADNNSKKSIAKFGSDLTKKGMETNKFLKTKTTFSDFVAANRGKLEYQKQLDSGELGGRSGGRGGTLIPGATKERPLHVLPAPAMVTGTVNGQPVVINNNNNSTSTQGGTAVVVDSTVHAPLTILQGSGMTTIR